MYRANTNGTKNACNNAGLQVFPHQWRLGFVNIMTPSLTSWKA